MAATGMQLAEQDFRQVPRPKNTRFRICKMPPPLISPYRKSINMKISRDTRHDYFVAFVIRFHETM